MFQWVRDCGSIDSGKSGLVTCRTVYGSGVGQGISVIFLEIFDGMDGILASSVDMTGTAVDSSVMFLFGMTVLTERGGVA
jgi:hypothetical protein